jgi:rod shape-determining protein MreC
VHDSRRTRLVLSVLLVAALAMITIDYRGGDGPLHSLSSLGNDVFSPMERAASAVTGPAADLVNGSSSGAKVSALQRQNAQLRAELSQAQLSKSQSAQLGRLLQLAGRGGYRVVAANVIAAATGYEDTVTIDAGSADGIRPNETVLNGDGLVGRVVSVSSTTATVLLATDGSSTVGARMAGSGEIGSVTGMGKGLSGPDTLQLQLFDASAVLQPGQQIVTFGSVGGSPYVPGVPIGTVIRVERSANTLTRSALIRPFVSFTALGVIGVVVTPPRVNPRDAVLPPRPNASPTPTVTKTVFGTPGASPGTSGASGTQGASPGPGTATPSTGP